MKSGSIYKRHHRRSRHIDRECILGAKFHKILDIFPKRIVACFRYQALIDFDTDALYAVLLRGPDNDRAVAAANIIKKIARFHPRQVEHAIDDLRR